MKEDLSKKVLSINLLMGALATLELEIKKCAYNRKKYHNDQVSYEIWNGELKERMKYRTYITNVLISDHGLDGAVIKDTISGVDKRVIPMKDVKEIVELIKVKNYQL